jgi:hypothetical protein
VSGAWVLKGTRMPVATIFQNLEAGASLDDVLTRYEGLDRKQVAGHRVRRLRRAHRPKLRSDGRRALMLVLLDQGTPVPIGRYLTRHNVRTATQQGWATLTIGELLAAAKAQGFDVLVTTDKRTPYQQNLTGRRIGILIIGYTRNGGQRRGLSADARGRPGAPLRLDRPWIR